MADKAYPLPSMVLYGIAYGAVPQKHTPPLHLDVEIDLLVSHEGWV